MSPALPLETHATMPVVALPRTLRSIRKCADAAVSLRYRARGTPGAVPSLPGGTVHALAEYEPYASRMNMAEAAVEVLRRRGAGRPMHYRDITETAIKGLESFGKVYRA